MRTPGKPLTPAELSALEHAFASDPGSDAYRPLTEAYLAAGRFMEAMVVCKKGVKAHPDDPAAKVLLARVYAEQGKDRKALEELGAVLAAFPTFAAANQLAGVLHLRLGEREAGEAALRRAADAAPNDPEIRALLEKHGVGPAAPAAPAAPPRPAAPAAAAGGPPVAPRVAAPGQRPPAPPPVTAQAPAAAPRERSEEVPLPTPPPARASGAAYAQQLAEKYGTQTFQIPHARQQPKRAGRGPIVATVALAAALAVALGGWALYSKARKERIEAIDRLLRETRELVDRDAYAAYGEAAAKLQEILKRDRDALAGHAFLAYVDAIRWAEHGDGDAVRDEAMRHVDAARKLGRHSHLVAAEAYLRASSGDAAGAKQALDAVLGGEDGSQSPFLLAVLGAVQLRAGDLDAARDALTRAQKANPGDARTAWLLAEQFRRRGEGYELQASGYYDYALRIQKEHLPSILGKALVVLGRGQLDEAARAAALVLAPQAGASKPQQALAHAVRAGVLAAHGKAAEAASEEQAAAKLDPASPEIPWLVGQRKQRAGDAAGAVEAFQRAVSLDDRRVSLYADLVRAQLAQEGGAQRALETLKRAVARVGESPRLALLLGDAYRAAGDADLARGQYEKAIALGKPFPDARVALARLHRDRNNVPGALVELTQAIDEYGQGGAGGAAAAYVEMADVERARGARAEVVADLYRKALDKDPASCEALWGAGKLEHDANKLADAKTKLGTYAKLCPRGPHAAEAARLAGGN
ncbi:Tetratricopeptide TPR_2 repeat protein [Anaeromyxobacter sp. K]|uniref:tetratricopeptide repeat protein n=1 Tax=Anaeromyxobacter sp. (strain K) TaxID=447217 RepID=UPI00017BE31A|nr:tetratricopeptide repeat protein [Anaeromyxobacter sp. K]ACG72171.1 Tetratricopeptide TPR_2 repeat protein [Anaeromyxobacter sp. K]